MGWPSTFEDIQDRRDEAEHFRQVGLVTVENIELAATPPTIDAVEVAPEPPEDPAKRHRMRNWMRRHQLARGRFEWTRDTVVWRGGAQRYTEQIKDVCVRAFDRGGTRRALQVDFKIASKGGGETHLSARFGSKDFQTLIQAMLVADRQAALAAITEELAQQRN
jgi:hypothetical protein